MSGTGAAKPRIGIVGSGVTHRAGEEPDLDTRFRMVCEAGVFDYFDKTPLPGEFDTYRRAVQKHALPLLAGGFYYTLGRDEPLLEWHLRTARELGTQVHNVQVLANDSAGRPVDDAQVAAFYMRAAEWGERSGVRVCFEVHVNMWSEHFGRVERVAARVAAQGGRFRLTLDASHVVFKIGNAAELAVQGLVADVESGAVVLDPLSPGSVCARWIDAGLVAHAHARPAVPANPVNAWARHPDGRVGRGIQYPFRRPAPGEWHSDWSEAALSSWKQAMRQLLVHHATKPSSELGTISTEIIPFADYGAGARYSLFDDSVAVAAWLRAQWAEVVECSASSRDGSLTANGSCAPPL